MWFLVGTGVPPPSAVAPCRGDTAVPARRNTNYHPDGNTNTSGSACRALAHESIAGFGYIERSAATLHPAGHN